MRHPKGSRLKLLLFLTQLAGLLLPPPGSVYKGGMGGVHQAKSSLIRITGEIHADPYLRASVTHVGHLRNLRKRFIFRPTFFVEEDPNIALYLPAGIALDANP